jgi:hypothetical protein
MNLMLSDKQTYIERCYHVSTIEGHLLNISPVILKSAKNFL